MAKQIQVDLKLPGTPQEQAALATAMAPRFGWTAMVSNGTAQQVPNPISALEYLETYAERMFRDVAQQVVGEVAAEAARKAELEKPANQFESRREAARKAK